MCLTFQLIEVFVDALKACFHEKKNLLFISFMCNIIKDDDKSFKLLRINFESDELKSCHS
jgi:hypothetical protein